jgi:hypothetical protein
MELLVYADHPNGSPWYGSESRHLLAALDSKRGDRPGGALPRIFFHYDDSGKPLQSLPMIRFGYGRNVIRILALGEEGVSTLQAHTPSIIGLLAEHFQRPLPVKISYPEVSIATSDRMMGYQVSSLVVALHAEKLDAFSAKSDEAKRAHIRAKIIRGLKRQCVELGLDLPDDVTVSLGSALPSPTRIRVKPNAKDYAFCISHVPFFCNLTLRGLWSVGHLTARGNGVIRRLTGIPAGVEARIQLLEAANG